MSEATLKVSTKVMATKATEILKEINTIEKKWNRICDAVKDSKTYWEGEASTLHQNSIKDEKEDMKTMLKRLKEHPKELRSMAGVYETAEENAVDVAKALPKDVIT